MNQLTLRGFGKQLENRIRELARREGLSLNQAALRLLRRGAGLGEEAEGPNTVGSDLDDHIGTWSAEEADEFDASLEDFGHVDEELWR